MYHIINFMQVLLGKDGSIQSNSATGQHFVAAEATVVDVHQQLALTATKQLPVVVPVEASRVTTPKTLEVPMSEVSIVVSPPSPAVHIPKVQAIQV